MSESVAAVYVVWDKVVLEAYTRQLFQVFSKLSEMPKDPERSRELSRDCQRVTIVSPKKILLYKTMSKNIVKKITSRRSSVNTVLLIVLLVLLVYPILASIDIVRSKSDYDRVKKEQVLRFCPEPKQWIITPHKWKEI
jgi:hypothetical protein